MFHSMPFARRTVRPIVTRPGIWVAATALGLFGAYMKPNADAYAAFAIIMLTGFSGLTALRALDDDQSSGTLVHLDVLPVSRQRIALEIAVGASVAFLPAVLWVLALALPFARTDVPWEMFVLSAPAPLALALVGTLASLRHRMRWPAKLGVLWALWMTVPGMFRELFRMVPRNNADAPVYALGVLVASLVAWWILWRLLHLIGGGWSDPGVARPAQPHAVPPSRASAFRETPDSWNPLLWRELTTGLGITLLLVTLGTVYVVTASTSGERPWDSAANRASTLLIWMLFYACMTSSLRTSRDRLSGLWAEVALTPLSVRAILWTRIFAMVGTMLVVSLLWSGLGWLLTDGPPRHVLRELSVVTFVAPILGGLGAVLAGFVTGLSGRGVVAAIGSVILAYLLAMLSILPAGALSSLYGKLGMYHATNSWTFLIASFTMGFLIFYGTLLWASLRGISQAVEEQQV